MKTLEEFIKEMEASMELRGELKNVKNPEEAAAFLKNHDCGATVKELAAFIRAQVKGSQGELSDADASAVAGGIWADFGYGLFWFDEDDPYWFRHTDY